ncbi:MAG: hypothetical protein JKY81_05905 [Colwellia sp.]|nr:hypothetical protein [Colwellia sp.]
MVTAIAHIWTAQRCFQARRRLCDVTCLYASKREENNLALSSEDYQLLLDALLTLATTQTRLANHDVTVHKLRKLLGIEKSSEKLGSVLKKAKVSSAKKNKKRKSDDDGFTPVKPTVVVHSLVELKKAIAVLSA